MYGVNSTNNLLLQIKAELKEREIENVEIRCNVVNREVNKTIKSVLGAINMNEAYSYLKMCSVSILVQDYTEHIGEWKGLSVSNKARKIPDTLKEYRKGAMNWANGRRSLILATKVFPQFIAQSVRYCMEVALNLFSPDVDRVNQFARLCEVAVISSILKSNVQLNQRSAETPLICQNSVTKHGLDKLLKKYLPKTLLAEIPDSLSDEEKETMTRMDLLGQTYQKQSHKKQRSNVFGAFQKAFTDLYASYLTEYRYRYGPTEDSKAIQLSQPPQSALLMLGNLTEQISQNLHLCSGDDLTFLQKKSQQIQQTIQTEMMRRYCHGSTNVNANTNTNANINTNTNKNTNALEHHNTMNTHFYERNDEKRYEIYFNGSIDKHNIVANNLSCFGSTLNTMEIFPTSMNFMPMNNRQISAHSMVPSSTTNICESINLSLPQKRKIHFNHYQNDELESSSKRTRYNDNDYIDTLNSSLSSVFQEDTDTSEPWPPTELLSTDFENETSFENQ